MDLTFTRDINTDLHCLSVPTGFLSGNLNCYLLLGKIPTLVDICPKTPGGYEALIKGLADHGLAPSDVKQLVITHAHPDHYGEARRFREESGAKVCAHESNVAMLADQTRGWERRGQYYIALEHYCGAPRELLEHVEQRYIDLAKTADSVQVDITLKEGDEIVMGDSAWQVLHTPGHSWGSISLYHPETRRLLGGDTLLNGTTANPMIEPPLREGSKRPRSLVNYFHTLAKLDRLDIDIIYPGHGEVFGDHHRRIKDNYTFHNKRKEAIYDAIVAGRDTIYTVITTIFPNLPAFQFPLAMFEVIGHLDLLEDEGRISYSVDADGVAHIHTS
jgi:glyoxylase-like metal-dependent hydrolase (beta-lactamase superfamily II)